MIEILESESFFGTVQRDRFYVGFLHSREAWFPLCLVSDAEQKGGLDTLCVAPSHALMDELVQSLLPRIPQVRESFIQYLGVGEIRELLSRYGLEKIAWVSFGAEPPGCPCGCGCG